VASHLRSIHAILVLKSMEGGAYHFTRAPKSLSPKYDMDAYTATLFVGEGGARLVLRVGSSKKLKYPTFNTNPMNILHKIIKIPL
jgi:hypothetical protein